MSIESANKQTLAEIAYALTTGHQVKANKFLPTLPLRAFEPYLRNGELVVKPGQYVQGVSGRKARFIAAGNGKFAASWAGRGDDFEFYTTRFQRAVWRHVNAHKGDLYRVLAKLPDTIPPEEAIARMKAKLDTKIQHRNVDRKAMSENADVSFMARAEDHKQVSADA